MPLLEMKSDLSKINTNFGSDTTTAGNTDKFPYESLNDWPPLNNAFIRSQPPNQIDFQYSTTPISNYVSSYEIPMPNVTTTTIQAQTQQESGNLFAGGIPPVQITIVDPLVTTNSHPLKPYKPSTVPPSRLLTLHKKGRTVDIGFSRQGLPLEKYYEQLNDNTGILGIRNDRRSQLGFEQPFVIKDIGDRWGFDGLQSSKFINPVVAEVVNFAGGLLDDLGGAVLGRSPNEYMGSAVGNLERIGKFLLTPQGIGFLLKQRVLKRRNAQKKRTDNKYRVFPSSDTLKSSPESGPTFEAINASINAALSYESPRKYDPLSLGSLPGVTRININKLDPSEIFTPYFDTIASYLSQRAVKAATTLKGQIAVTFRDKIAIPVKKRLNTFLTDNVPKGVIKSVGELKKDIKGLDAKRRAFNERLESGNSPTSKIGLISIKPNVKALSQIGQDQVNLIPYGPRTDKEAKADDLLDFIPFRFEDSYGNRMVFRAILSGITDTFTPEYSSERYIGRPDNVYVYMGTQREISFTFDIYPKSDMELVTLWEKMNYLAGLTYPSWAPANGGGQSMIAPFSKLTIGQMYTDTPGYISSLTYTVQDNGTWETMIAQLPKYIQASCTFVYIGNRLPSSTQKHYELPWVPEKKYVSESDVIEESVDTTYARDHVAVDPTKSAEATKQVMGQT